MPRVPAHQVTTRNLGAAYPFIAEAGLGRRGVVIGDDLLGGSFVFDPFELYAAGVVSNPNMVVFGQIGRGKSAFVKTFLWRQAVFGRRAWVVDPKGEYGDLADAWGVRPVALRPGEPSGSTRWTRDPTPRDDTGPDASGRRRMELLSSLASACLGRGLVPRERAALGAALAEATRSTAVPTVPVVVEALLTPTADAARALRTEQRDLLEDGRDVALELRRLVHGDLRGMFDGPTTAGLDLSSPLVVLDLSALYSSAALGVLMACATAWLQAALARTAVGDGGASPARAVSSSWWTRRGRSCRTWAWRAGCSRRGSSPAPSASPTWRSCTGCRTCARSARRTPSRWRWPRGSCRIRRPASSTHSRRASSRRRRSCCPCRPPRRICSRSSGGASPCGRWVSDPFWCSTDSARRNGPSSTPTRP